MRERQKRIWTKEDIQLNKQSTELTAQLHGLSCPQCKSRKFTKYGQEKGNQRYRCSKCGKHFRSTTGNSIHQLHLKPKIQAYVDCMNQGLSLRKTAQKLDISLQTAFRWRHRFLSAARHKPEKHLHQHTTISTVTLPFSSKSKTALTSKKTNINSLLQIDATGKLSINVIGPYGQTNARLASKLQSTTSYIASRTLPRTFKKDSAACRTVGQLRVNNSEASQYMFKCF